jgi:hypothetical protein
MIDDITSARIVDVSGDIGAISIAMGVSQQGSRGGREARNEKRLTACRDEDGVRRRSVADDDGRRVSQ